MGIRGRWYESGTSWRGLDAERQLERATDLRPEFTQHIVTDIPREAVPDSSCRVAGTVLVARVIDVTQCGRARGSEPLGIVEGSGAVLGLSNKQVRGRMN